MILLLDTDILIGAIRENTDAVDVMNFMEQRGEKLNTTVINVFEILEGVLLGTDKEKRFVQAEKFLKSFVSYDFDNYASRIAANISSDLKKKGETLDFQDIVIAAIAINNNEVLITRNIKHFSRIKGLKIEKW